LWVLLFERWLVCHAGWMRLGRECFVWELLTGSGAERAGSGSGWDE
jgi:hypothetical protein